MARADQLTSSSGMRIAVLGTGRMAGALGRLFTRAGNEVFFGSRAADRALSLARATGESSRGGSYAEALAWSELGALAGEWSTVPAMLRLAGPWRGRVLLDCTNPEEDGGRSLAVGHLNSGAELIARWADGARVVKALNHVYAEILDGVRAASPRRAAAFLCGDDRDAKSTVTRLLRRCGLQPVDAGPLRSARFLEPLAALMVELVRGQGWRPEQAALGFPQISACGAPAAAGAARGAPRRDAGATSCTGSRSS
jgi:predicted dinucleotide-binding enzyme